MAVPSVAAYADVPETATILFTSSQQLAQRDVIAIRPEGAGSPKPYLDAAWDEMDPRVSPDGTLASFTSREQGPWEVWIRDYPVPRGKWKVSTDGGHASRWSSDGRFLYYWKTASVAGEVGERTEGVGWHHDRVGVALRGERDRRAFAFDSPLQEAGDDSSR